MRHHDPPAPSRSGTTYGGGTKSGWRPGLWAALLLLGAACLTALPVSGRAAPTGTIDGVLTDGTAGKPVAGQEVRLNVLGADQPSTVTATTGPDGSFRFDGLETDGTRAYQASTTFMDVEFNWDPVQFSGDGPIQLPLTVYQPTSDPAGVSLTTASFVVADVDSSRQIVRMVEFLTFENRGNTAYVGSPTNGRPEVVNIPTPAGTLEVSPIAGVAAEDFIQQPTGFVISRPLPPGTTDMTIGYDIAYSDTVKDLVLSFPFHPERALLLVPVGTLGVQGAATSEGTVPISEGVTVEQFALQPGGGNTASVSLTGLPEAPGRLTPDSSAGRAAAISAAVLAAIALAVTAWRGRRRQAPEPVPADRRGLVEAIARLDLEAEAGRLPDGEYQARRRALKARVASSGETP